MKKWILTAMTFLAALALFLCLADVLRKEVPEEIGGKETEAAWHAEEEKRSETEKKTVEDHGEEQYLVKSYYGKVGVFASGEKEPLYVTEIDTDSLREVDKRSMEDGVRLYAYEEVLRLLEDFNS